MNIIKKIWPTPFKIKSGSISSLLIRLILFLVGVTISCVLLSILSAIPIVGIIFTIIGSLMGLYTLVGCVLCVLVFLGIKFK